MKRYVDPLLDLGNSLLQVEKPSRYTGAEYGLLAKKNASLQTIIAFPDLYEIGMSNKALRILYNSLNRIDDISTDRVFSPAPDFEALLREKQIPLYGLETGLNIKAADILMFTLGYELGITNVLTIMDLAGIPLVSKDRGEGDPVIIMGGPCVSNPLPYSAFIDCFWIGEAEAGFFDLVAKARDLKKRGGDRNQIIEAFCSHASVWSTGKKEARRAIYTGFCSGKPEPAVFPVPVMKVVQHHGAVEIMRGCPNGCRFCHAGFWYRPMRQKAITQIQAEAAAFIDGGGYREISLSSLSTGDYAGIGELVENLNREYKKRHISFQLPSLKVTGFSLELLEKVSEVRKSGLTFAVESPGNSNQLSINKKVSLEDVISIIREARSKGWRGIKFYFMIGLPLTDSGLSEEDAIVDFISKAARETGMHFNINLGTFIPKPHTPFQRAGQLGLDEAVKKLRYIREQLKPRGHKVSIQDPFISVLEGIISRGNIETGNLILEAWEKGCRLDAWTEYLKKDIWEELLEIYEPMIRQTLDSIPKDSVLPWDFIALGTNSRYLANEKIRSEKQEITSTCMQNCTHHCGLCDDKIKIVENIIHANEESPDEPETTSAHVSTNHTLQVRQPDPATRKILFSFTKEGRAIFHSHLDLVEVFSMALIRARIPVIYSSGFNPLPVLEIVSPLALGITGANETAFVEIESYLDTDSFIQHMNESLVPGLKINRASLIYIPPGTKKHSLSAMLWGSVYQNPSGGIDTIVFQDEKKYRGQYSYWDLKRLEPLAKDPENPLVGLSFFEIFPRLYKKHDPANNHY